MAQSKKTNNGYSLDRDYIIWRVLYGHESEGIQAPVVHQYEPAVWRGDYPLADYVSLRAFCVMFATATRVASLFVERATSCTSVV